MNYPDFVDVVNETKELAKMLYLKNEHCTPYIYTFGEKAQVRTIGFREDLDKNHVVESIQKYIYENVIYACIVVIEGAMDITSPKLSVGKENYSKTTDVLLVQAFYGDKRIYHIITINRLGDTNVFIGEHFIDKEKDGVSLGGMFCGLKLCDKI